jgi:LysM repeat protein
MMQQRSASARALVIISTIVVVLVLLLATAVHALGGSPPAATSEYRVQGGDTLWSIAAEVADDDADLRGVVASIRRLNDLSGAVIHAGDLLVVPADR